MRKFIQSEEQFILSIKLLFFPFIKFLESLSKKICEVQSKNLITLEFAQSLFKEVL